MNNKFSRKEIEAARYLGRLRPLKSDVASKKAKVEEMETLALPHGISYDGIKVQTSPGNPQETAMVLAAEALEEYFAALKRYQKVCMEVGKLIASVEEMDMECASILRLRYICGMQCLDIADRLHISASGFFVRYRTAHTKAAECLDTNRVEKEI